MINWNIPKTITQGDSFTWSQSLNEHNPTTDTLSCFLRGQSALDLTGVPNGGQWEFTVTSPQSDNLLPGRYKVQFVVYKNGTNKITLGSADLLVSPSFENLSELETRTADEIELSEITKAIAKLVSGAVSEYEIGDRRVRYQDLDQLTRRQEYLRRRIAIANGKVIAGGRNVGVSFNN